jgi:hypothetical protein
MRDYLYLVTGIESKNTHEDKSVWPAVLLSLACTNIDASPIATLTLQSQPGDYIGQGGTFDITYTPSNGLFGFSAQITNTLQDGSPSEVSFLRKHHINPTIPGTECGT